MITAATIQKLTGREPTARELADIQRVQASLGASDNDAILLVVAALNTHQKLLSDFPNELSQEFAKIVLDARLTAEKQLQASVLNVQASLAEAISVTAQEVAQTVSKRSLTQWICASIAIIGTVLLTTGYMAREAGLHEGFQRGLAEARDERAAATWSNTANGRAAYRLDKINVLSPLLTCTIPGWRRDGKFCHPGKAEDGAFYGYRLP